ncbi:MAG: thermonuclease family protein [Candidatus Omnitrophota bacterium]
MKKIIPFILIIIIIATSYEGSVLAKGKNGLKIYVKKQSRSEQAYDNILVTEVVSGDIIRLENGELIRLIGVDTPELNRGVKFDADVKITGLQSEVLEVMAKESWLFLKDLVLDKNIRVEFDKKRKDLYGVLLGYVFIIQEFKKRGDPRKEEVFVNAECIKNGYTYNVDNQPNDYYKDLFDRLHQEVGLNSKGIWKQWQQQ